MGRAFDQLELTLCVVFGPDGSRVSMGLSDGRMEIRHLATDELSGEPLKPEPNWHTVAAAAFSPDGSRIAIGDMAKTVWIGDAETL